MESLTRREFGAATAGTAAAMVTGYGHTLYDRMTTPDENDIEHVFVARSHGFGERIRAAREARGLSIEQCAHAFDERNPNFWYAHWQWLEQGGEYDHKTFMDIWPTIEALLGVPITTLLYGGSELALAKEWVRERLQDFAPPGEIKPDLRVSGTCERIKHAREWRRLSVADAAARAKVAERDWQRFENGGEPPGVIEFLEISHALKVDSEWLLTGTPGHYKSVVPPAA